MGVVTKIQWTDSTWNPWWGCQRVSPGCEHCYAEAFAKRTGNAVWGPEAPRRFFGDKHWHEPEKWDRKARADGRRHKVFCASMADVFEDRRDLDAQRTRLFDLIERTPNLDWQLLTKRPENIARLAARWGAEAPPSVWLGTTVEDQKRADVRVPALLAAPRATVKFLSAEPLLGALNLRDTGGRDGLWKQPGGVDWVIVGGESGPGARPFQIEWARDLVRQCRSVTGIACFVKQMGARAYDGHRRLPLLDGHGGNLSEWPSGDWPRECPEKFTRAAA